MRLCLIISSLASGGAERVATTLANHWVQKGWYITVITLASRATDFYALDPAVRRIALNCIGQSRTRAEGLLNNLGRLRLVRRALQAEKPDIALGFMPSINIITGLACLGTGITAVGSEHTHPPMQPLEQPWRSLRRALYPRLAAVSALTQTSADWVRQHTGARRVPMIPNPIPYPLPSGEPRIDPKTILRGLVGEYTLLAVGRLTFEKGFDRLLDAFAALRKRHPQWHLVILGDGPLRDALCNQRARLGLESSVALPGVVGNVGDWYAAADTYVMTSHFEGFGNTLAEALSYGVPAVAVDCETGPREILRHGVDGLLVPQDDSHALIQALDRVMGDPELRARFAKRAVEARERFAVGRVAAKWESLFEEIMQVGRK